MDREQIIQWARQAGAGIGLGRWLVTQEELEVFAKLVRDDYSNKHAQLWLKRIDEAVRVEREACAKVCDEARTYISKNNAVIQSSAQDCAAAIRARSE